MSSSSTGTTGLEDGHGGTSGSRGNTASGDWVVEVVDTDHSGGTAETIAIQTLPQVPGGVSANGSTFNGTTAVTVCAAGCDLIVGSWVASQRRRAARSRAARVGSTWARAGLKRPTLEDSTSFNGTETTLNKLTLSEHDAGAGAGSEEEESFDGVHFEKRRRRRIKNWFDRVLI